MKLATFLSRLLFVLSPYKKISCCVSGVSQLVGCFFQLPPPPIPRGTIRLAAQTRPKILNYRPRLCFSLKIHEAYELWAGARVSFSLRASSSWKKASSLPRSVRAHRSDSWKSCLKFMNSGCRHLILFLPSSTSSSSSSSSSQHKTSLLFPSLLSFRPLFVVNFLALDCSEKRKKLSGVE